MDVADRVIFSKLGGDEILTRFDEMVQHGYLFYGPSKNIKISDQGFRVRFRHLRPPDPYLAYLSINIHLKKRVTFADEKITSFTSSSVPHF